MRLEAVQVTDPVPDELGPDEHAAVVPPLAVRGEDAVAQELLPLLVEGLSLAVVLELRRQDGLYVLGVGCEDGPLADDAVFSGPAPDVFEEPSPELEVLVLDVGADAPGDEVDTYEREVSARWSTRPAPCLPRLGSPPY